MSGLAAVVVACETTSPAEAIAAAVVAVAMLAFTAFMVWQVMR